MSHRLQLGGVSTEKGLSNAHYARPATVDLAGEVAGRRVLDAGCGSGPLMESMRDALAFICFLFVVLEAV